MCKRTCASRSTVINIVVIHLKIQGTGTAQMEELTSQVSCCIDYINVCTF